MTQTLARPKTAPSTFRLEERVVLVADVNGFSAMAGRLRGEGDRLAQFFQATYEVVGDAVTEHGGTILKYLGDAVLCLFPGGAEDAAVQAGRAMRKRFEQVAADFGQAGQTGLKVLIGSGPLYVGEVGHRTMRGPDAFGAELFNAATLQSKGIAFTDAARRRLGDQYAVRALPEQTVRWQPEPLRGWELVE